MSHAIRANYARIARAHPEVACWRPSAGPTGASGRSDSGQTAAAPPEGVWCSCEALAWRHKIRSEKIPQFPESAHAFTTALGASRAALPSSVACGTPPRVICVSVRGSERQQGGRLTYTLHSSRSCAESVLTAVDRAGSTATCVPQSTRRRVDPSLRTLDQPQRSQPPPPESAHPTICATRWSDTSRVRRLCGERYQREGPAWSRQRPGSGDQFTASQAGSSATTGHSREPAAG